MKVLPAQKGKRKRYFMVELLIQLCPENGGAGGGGFVGI